ncbi:MAG: FtsW/RodA/SpoVE family cell cycle protein, partial [Acetatifactor sp.]|nr:FtsW/RodA/SpoVE family cell cycle protein [Acetatifactor sp.]
MADRSRDRRKRKKEQTEYYFDYSLLFIVLFLMGFGLVMIYSASSYEAQQDFGSGTYYLRKQLVADILGLVVMIVMANIPYRFWRRFTTLVYFASFGLIFLVLTPLGVASHGATRWVGIPGTSFNLQPAEVAKVCMILFLANMVCLMGKKLRTAKG